MRPLFTLGSVYSTNTSRAEHKTETNNSLAGGKPLPTYMRARGFELGATENRGSGQSGTRTRDRRIGVLHFSAGYLGFEQLSINCQFCVVKALACYFNLSLLISLI